MQASPPKAPEDWRSPRRCRAIRRFMVPMHAEKRNGALHEPSEAQPGFGVRESSGALAMEASPPKAPEDWRSPRRYRAIRRFMVPMHAKKRTGALHEPHKSRVRACIERKRKRGFA